MPPTYTVPISDASFALVENDGDYICSKGFERWLQVQLPYIYGAFLSREDFTKNVYDVMYHFVATGKESAFEKLKAKPKINKIINVLEPIAMVAVILIVNAYLVDNSYNPFLYFRF